MNEIIAGRYRIIKRIGQGAFGQVYLADDTRVGRKIVVKLSPSGINPSERGMFEREAGVSARLHHANIAAITDFGVTADHQAFLVREYVEGKTLEELLKESRLGGPLLKHSDALQVTKAIAQGLSEAHRNNIIHRDLKPGNVAIPQIGNRLLFNEATILDFGVFGELIDKQSEATTRVGDIYGTPRYMSPEQFRADEQTTATDIYGLGMLLYEMVYNRLPFAEDTLVEVIRAKVEGNLYFPEDDKVPTGILALIKDCLKTDRKDRIQTADEVIRRVEDLQGPGSIDSNPASEHDGYAKNFPLPNAELIPDSRPTGQLYIPRQQGVDYEDPYIQRYQAPPTAAQYPDLVQSSMPKSSSPGIKVLCYVLVTAFLVPLIVLMIWFVWDYLTWGALIGVIFVALGVGAGVAARHLVKGRRGEIEKDAQNLIFGTRSRDVLTQSLAIQVDSLLAKLSRVDDKILGMSLAIMVREFKEAKEATRRTDLLIEVVNLSEKISVKLSPWYVRHEKLVAFMVAMVGVLGGIATISINIINTARGK